MYHYSPSPLWLAVPGIGFPQNISVGPNVLDSEDFRDWPFTARCKTDGQHDVRQRGHGFRPGSDMAAIETTHRSILMCYR
jgi:hypothetical protein